MSTVFRKIIDGDISCYKIFEGEHTLAFLTKDAIRLGHSLIIPKIDIDYFIDVPGPYYSAIFKNARPLAKAIHRATGCKRIGTLIAGWDVPHFHYHLIPMFDYYDLDPAKAKERKHEENMVMQERIINELKKSRGPST